MYEAEWTGTGVPLEVGRDAVQWLGKGGRENGFKCARSEVYPGCRNSVWEAHFPRSWWLPVAMVLEAQLG